VSGTPSDPVFGMGRMLVQELDELSGRDTLAHWMCHHVAEVIARAEASGVAADIDHARKVILELWEHRSSLPRDSRPLRDFDLIFQTLAGLDPTDPSARYFSAIREVASDDADDADDADDEGRSVASWLSIAEGLDCTARWLIRECLLGAAQAAGGEVGKWVTTAEEAGFRVDPDLRTVQVLLGLDRGESEEDREADRGKLEELLQKLESYRELSTIVEHSLREQLKEGSVGE
jgi:hypothetical protein